MFPVGTPRFLQQCMKSLPTARRGSNVANGLARKTASQLQHTYKHTQNQDPASHTLMAAECFPCHSANAGLAGTASRQHAPEELKSLRVKHTIWRAFSVNKQDVRLKPCILSQLRLCFLCFVDQTTHHRSVIAYPGSLVLCWRCKGKKEGAGRGMTPS